MTSVVDASRPGATTSTGGRGGAASSHATSSVEYVDGGLYRSGVAGGDGRPYSTGRGGAGNIDENADFQPVDATAADHYPRESVRPPGNPDAAAAGGRGGAGNIATHADITSQDVVPSKPQQQPHEDEEVPYGVESNPNLEKGRLQRKLSHLGLADKIKFGVLSMVKKD
ncbi:hypothetical protein PYCC9005_002935 [Savitreella phatthalungensis]